ncbi:MAG: hypothetical protein K9H64_13245 [Bacteroidales bacterium]|nr:hypothetical protein [Bacteroidales bacterium]MCF8456974.1 hypothetical protein [Bacteroidales bacterium]
MLKRNYILLFIFVLLSCNLSSSLASNSESDKNVQKHEITVKDKDHERIDSLCKLSIEFNTTLYDRIRADSVSELAVVLALSTFRPDLILIAYSNYLENVDLALFNKKALKYALAAKQLSLEQQDQEWAWQSTMNLTNVYLSDYDFHNALISAYSAITIARDLNDESKIAESYLMIGRSLEGNNQKIEAFRNYLLATKISRKTENRRLTIMCYSQLSDFYRVTNLHSKAASYKLMEAELITNHSPIDSLALMWVQYNLLVINLESDEARINENAVKHILDFASHHNQVRLKEFTLSLYRSILIKLDRIDLLKQFYTIQHPEEFESLKKSSLPFYYRLKAYFSEEESQIDSANYYFKNAEELLNSDPNFILRSHFHLRYGQFFIRMNEPKQAIEQLKKAYDLAQEANFLGYMLEASVYLEKLYVEDKNFEKAWHFASNSKQLNDSINKLAEKGKLLMLEINHETQQRQMLEEQEMQQTIRRHNLQYMAMVIGILVIFLILILLGSFKVPKWAIQVLGFFSFIFLFEFIILVADEKIHHFTHGEPWKILLIKIFLIALLLPFHHWVEHKVVHYLINKKLIRFSVSHFRNLFQKKESEKPDLNE